MYDDLPTREPMRPRRRPRRMRAVGRRAPAPFRPTFTTLFAAAASGDLRTNRHGRFVDATRSPVDQRIARAARGHGLIARVDEPADWHSQRWALTPAGLDAAWDAA